MKGVWLCGAAVVVAAIANAVRADEFETASLKGIGPVRVIVENANETENGLGLTAEAAETAVSLRLRANRVRITKAEGSPVLYVNVTASGQDPQYAVSYSVELLQSAAIKASGQNKIVPTWHRGATGLVGTKVAKAMVLDSIKGAVDEFCNDYLTANEDAVATAADSGAGQLAFP
jgi:hypothetical protein